jgi:hypothetical protein
VRADVLRVVDDGVFLTVTPTDLGRAVAAVLAEGGV